jgi:HD-GYP domain-containing protein (c-di-GMP phosphodiesterase class II)/DNA-binding CsgD family transcriptional regulator
MEGPRHEPAADPPRGHVRAVDLLGALSLASDLALGLPSGHGVRATYIGARIAGVLSLTAGERADLFYAEMLMGAGCTAWTSQLASAILGDEIAARRQLFFFSDPGNPRDVVRWLAGYVAADATAGVRLMRAIGLAFRGRRFMVEGLRNTAEVAARFAGRLEQPPRVQEALRFAFERWDGSGPFGCRAASIPLLSRILIASIFLEVCHQVDGRDAAVALARARGGRAFDPTVVGAFERLAGDDGFWRGLESESIWPLVHSMEPETALRYFSATRLEAAVRTFGDFADLKSFYTAGHARRVAALAERVASAMKLPPGDVVTIRRAAMLQDIGIVAVPSLVLHKPEERLSQAEFESLRFHPYHSERILSRVPAFAPACPIVGAHHERPDGRGYRGLSRRDIPVGAHVTAVADRFDGLTHRGPERAAVAPDEALAVMGRGAGAEFDREALTALGQVVGGGGPESACGHPGRAAERAGAAEAWPAGLTDREVEIVRMLATGASRRLMATRLSIGEQAVVHHLSLIYDKIDVRTDAEATLYAMENALLP